MRTYQRNRNRQDQDIDQEIRYRDSLIQFPGINTWPFVTFIGPTPESANRGASKRPRKSKCKSPDRDKSKGEDYKDVGPVFVIPWVGDEHATVEEDEAALDKPQGREEKELPNVELLKASGDDRVVCFSSEVVGNPITDVMVPNPYGEIDCED